MTLLKGGGGGGCQNSFNFNPLLKTSCNKLADCVKVFTSCSNKIWYATNCNERSVFLPLPICILISVHDYISD